MVHSTNSSQMQRQLESKLPAPIKPVFYLALITIHSIFNRIQKLHVNEEHGELKENHSNPIWIGKFSLLMNISK